MININSSAIKNKAIAAFQKTVEQLDQPLKDAIEQPLYDWPRATHRKSGEVVGSPRNIVDLGNLRDSQQLVFITETKAQYQWDVPYAVVVHEGSITSNGTYKPGRRWTEEALSQFDAIGAFTENLKDAFNS